MTFKQFFQSLSLRVGPEYGVGPDKFQKLLTRLGNPHLDYAVIHVAGTNGKGTVCHLSASVLQAAGHKTGLFISPHLQTPCERISVNGKKISPQKFQFFCRQVIEQEQELNFFEVITAAAFLYFSQQKDPTNVCSPVASVITSVGLDHCAVLGNSLSQIAKEKAGVIKKNIPVFLPKFSTEIKEIFELQACQKQAPIVQVSARGFALSKIDWKKNRVWFRHGRSLWNLPLLGGNQLQNAALVYQLCRYLKIQEKDIQKGFANLKISCRFETVIQEGKIGIFDGAHNLPAVKNFIEFYGQSPWYREAALVCGFMKDKEFGKMLKLFKPHFQEIFLTVPRGSRAADIDCLQKTIETDFKISFFQRPALALKAAQKKYGVVVVSGSFYLAAQLRSRVGARKD